MTANDFLDLLRRSQLVDENQLTKFFGLREDAEGVAGAMVQAGIITEWQSQKLLARKWKGFYLGDHKLLRHLCKTDVSQDYLAQHVSTGRRVKMIVFPPGRGTETTFMERMGRENRQYEIRQDGSLRYVVTDYEE